MSPRMTNWPRGAYLTIEEAGFDFHRSSKRAYQNETKGRIESEINVLLFWDGVNWNDNHL